MSAHLHAVEADEREPLSRTCSGGCGRRLLVAEETGWNVRPGKGKRPPFSEADDPQSGKRLYYCRYCTQDLYRRGA